MSKLFKLLSLFLAVGVVAAACSSDSSDDAGTTTAAPAETTEAPATTAVELDADGSLLDTVIARGKVHCGVSGSAVAFSETQADGSVTGFDADYCRAVAAAVLGDANAVEFVALTASERFTAVQTGDVDLLMRNTTWTQSRDSDLGMDFGPTTYYDGQQLMARVSDGFDASSTVADLDGAIVCTNAGTTTEKNIAEAAELAGADIELLAFETSDEVYETFIAGGCDITTTDGSALVGRKVKQQPADQEWVIFPLRSRKNHLAQHMAKMTLFGQTSSTGLYMPPSSWMNMALVHQTLMITLTTQAKLVVCLEAKANFRP